MARAERSEATILTNDEELAQAAAGEEAEEYTAEEEAEKYTDEDIDVPPPSSRRSDRASKPSRKLESRQRRTAVKDTSKKEGDGREGRKAGEESAEASY